MKKLMIQAGYLVLLGAALTGVALAQGQGPLQQQSVDNARMPVIEVRGTPVGEPIRLGPPPQVSAPVAAPPSIDVRVGDDRRIVHCTVKFFGFITWNSGAQNSEWCRRHRGEMRSLTASEIAALPPKKLPPSCDVDSNQYNDVDCLNDLSLIHAQSGAAIAGPMNYPHRADATPAQPQSRPRPQRRPVRKVVRLPKPVGEEMTADQLNDLSLKAAQSGTTVQPYAPAAEPTGAQ